MKPINVKMNALCKTTKNASECLRTSLKLISNFPIFYVATPHHKTMLRNISQSPLISFVKCAMDME